MERFFSPISSEDQKQKKVFTKDGTLVFPNSSGDLRSDARQSQIIGRDADVDHTQIVGERYSQIIGGDISPHSPGFRHPWQLRR